jgi:hypothetical protein
MTCKITCREANSYTNRGKSPQVKKKALDTCTSPEPKPKSVDDSPKLQSRKSKTDKTTSLAQVNKGSPMPKTKQKAPNQLDVDQKVSPRRKSAPGVFTSS